jgi:Secretion system C-terminal sorting domain
MIMRAIFTLAIVLFSAYAASAQWSNTTNFFADSLHMPVSTAPGVQNHSVSIRSYPDSGYIVFWEDYRNNNKVDIYAQKYDKAGHAIWTANGLPVATGPDPRHFYTSTSGEYRNYSYAVTDSSNGFYIAFQDDSNSNFSWQRVMVQHVRNDGSVVFPGAGYLVAATPPTETWNYSRQQLIADGNKGFYIGFLQTGSSQDVYAYCMRDEGGTMKIYGGGQMDRNAYLSQISSCSNYTLLERDAFASDYYIYSDLQKGCNVAMMLAENAGGNDRTFLGYNRLVRVKKASAVMVTYPDTKQVNYPKDSVMIYYNISFHTYIFQCGSQAGTGFVLDGNGYARVSDLLFNGSYPKGVVIPTAGNINIDMLTWDQRSYIDSSGAITKYATVANAGVNEKYDSIPYYYTVFPFEPASLTGPAIPGLDHANVGQDTILSTGSYADYEVSLTLTGNKVYATAATYPLGAFSDHAIVLQQLEMLQMKPDSFALNITTGNKGGVVIGKEIDPGFSGSSVTYSNPIVVAGSPGNALFYINETNAAPRVSPIVNRTQLAWGAMGRPIGSGRDVHGIYVPADPFVTLDPQNGSGIINWDDGRGGTAGQAENIYMLHLDSLNLVAYTPPAKTLQALINGASFANATALVGSSNAWTTIDAIGGTPAVASPVMQILDNYNLGAVQVILDGHTGPVRSFNGAPYLDRNFTIKVENNPGGAASIGLRFFFTTAEFAALQAADPTILTPGDLEVIKQPNNTTTVPDTYTPIVGETVITPSSWGTVSGGYYIELNVTSFSNFFIQKGIAPLPVTWLGVQARWKDASAATLTWQVANQQNVKNYTVQYSLNGSPFSDVVTVGASALTAYSCTAPASAANTNEYRIAQQDLDGKKNYSIVVALQSAPPVALSIYPNPAKTIVYVTGLMQTTEISLLDEGGSLLGLFSMTPANNAINTSQLTKGLYFLRLTTGKETRILKFIKE